MFTTPILLGMMYSSYNTTKPPAGSQLVIDFLQTGLDDVKCNFPLYYRKVLLFLSLFFLLVLFSVLMGVLFPFISRWMDGWMGKSMWGKILATYRVYFEVTSNHQAKRYNTSHSRGAPALLPTSSPSTSPPADTVAKTPVSDDGFGLFCWKPYSRTVSNWSRRIFTSSRDGFCTGIVFFYVFLF